MKVSDVLAHLRARLRDDNGAFTRQGDSYLMQLIYFWQNQILSEFGQNIKEIIININNSDEIELPFKILRICAIYLNSVPIRLNSYLSNIQQGSWQNLSVFEKTEQIYGFSHKVSGECKIYAIKKAFINDKDDEMILSDDFINFLVLNIFLDLLKANAMPENTHKIDYFEQRVLPKERQRLQALINRKSTPFMLRSPFIRA